MHRNASLSETRVRSATSRPSETAHLLMIFDGLFAELPSCSLEPDLQMQPGKGTDGPIALAA
jgi:hypothetical protein